MENKRGMGSIVRIDQPKDDSDKGTHGWQVRASTDTPKKYHSKLFSDSKHGGDQSALEAAQAYLKEYRAKNPYIPRHGFRSGTQANNTSGVIGVYRTYHYYRHDEKKIPRYYWEAFCPIGPDGQRNRWGKRFYVHTHGEEKAKELAIEFRKNWEEAAREGEEALKEFFVKYHYNKSST